MADVIQIEGLKELQALMRQVPGRVKPALAGAMWECGEEVRTESIQQVPVDTGALKNSARSFLEVDGRTVAARSAFGSMGGAAAAGIGPVSGSDGVAVTIAYGGAALEYALPVHERTDTHHPHGKHHFLSDPAKAYPLGSKLGSKLRGRLERAIAKKGA